MPEDLEQILEGQGIDRANLEAATELGRLLGDETGLCCEDLGRFILRTYQILEGEHGFTEA